MPRASRSSGAMSRVSADGCRRVLAEFSGEIDQLPPMFSAIKHQGRPLYELARQGWTRKSSARPVRDLRLPSWLELLSPDDPEFCVRVRCSKGTYIRTLAHDIGAAAGLWGASAALRRTGIGALRTSKMPLHSARLEAAPDRSRALVAPAGADLLVSDLPASGLDPPRRGSHPARPAGGRCRMHCPWARSGASIRADGAFLGLGMAGEGRAVVPKRMRAGRVLMSAADRWRCSLSKRPVQR